MSYPLKFHNLCLPPNPITQGRLERYRKYFTQDQKFPVQFFLNVSGLCFVNQKKRKLGFSKYDICMHSGLNGGCPKGHSAYDPNKVDGRCHNSERIMFGSFDPKYEKFLDPCSLDRVRDICKAQNMPLSEDYNLKQDGKIFFCLNGSDAQWYPTLFNPSTVEVIKGYVDKIREHTDKEILIRFHPLDSANPYYNKIFKDHGLKIFKGTHREFVEQASCIVVDHTTMVYEAAVRGIPAFYLGNDAESCVGNDYFLKNYKLFNFNNIEPERLPNRFSYLQKYFSGLLLLEELEDGKLFEYIDKYLIKYF